MPKFSVNSFEFGWIEVVISSERTSSINEMAWTHERTNIDTFYFANKGRKQ